MKIDNIIKELKWRDMLKDVSNNIKIINGQKEKTGVYCGFDPTANSLHIGNLIPLLTLKRFAYFGFKPFVIIGQATAVIGDPSGKKMERPLKSSEEIKNNISNIENQIKKIIPDVIILNNNDWLANMKMIDFLYNVGKTFNISYLINKEHIKSRLKSGISFTEFTYTLLQSYDFLHVYKNNNIHVQIGGSDQWGNIVSGIEYIKNNIDDSKAAGITIKLLLKTDGNKFGKTENGTIWLDKNKTNPYEFYQFFFNQNDDLSIILLKYFSFFTKKQIESIIEDHLKNPKEHYIQKQLASCLVKIVHSEEDLQQIYKINELLFNNNLNNIDKNIIENLLIHIIPSFQVLVNDNIIDILTKNKICISKREAKEFIFNNAIMINNILITSSENYSLDKIQPFFNKYFILKKGKKKHYLLIIK